MTPSAELKVEQEASTVRKDSMKRQLRCNSGASNVAIVFSKQEANKYCIVYKSVMLVMGMSSSNPHIDGM